MFKKYLPLIFWAILIFVLSSIPGDNYPSGFFDFSAMAHVVEYFILGFLTARVFNELNKKQIILIIIICSLFALSDEVHQIFVINRSFSGLDLLIDFFSVILGIGFNSTRIKRIFADK